MRSNSPISNMSNGTASDFAAPQQSLQRPWHRLPAGMPSPIWSSMLGALLILGMLLAFHQVVHGAVQQGALRQHANAVQAEATWRCNALPGQGARDSCLGQLNAPAGGDSEAQAQTTLVVRDDGLNSPSQNR